MTDRKMPEKIRLGQHASTTLGHTLHMRERNQFKNPDGLRTVMGFVLPKWQRPFVWTDAQCEAFLRSAWLGLPLGTYSYNMFHKHPALDGYLIDGQQRMVALERYFDDEFPVFGWRWSEVTEADRRGFTMSTIFASYITDTDDETYLREYYSRMNFGGTAHTPDQAA